jgi:imidazolonepropionase-like amidohydrolase
MRIKSIEYLLSAFAIATISTLPGMASDEIPGAPQTGPIAIVGATIHPVSGPEVSDGTLLFTNGKIVALGTEVSLPAECEKIDATGKHVYPGLIHAHTQLGLIEIPSIRATVDVAETGRINGNIRYNKCTHRGTHLS